MDTQVASASPNPQTGDDKTEAGASYALAVQNFKSPQQSNTGSNKENIKESFKEEPQTVSSIEFTEKPKQTEPEPFDDDGSFTPVINHSRKERKNEKKKQKQHLHNGVPEKHERHHEKSHDKKEPHLAKPKLEPSEKDKDSYSKDMEDQSDSRKVFVAAPLPKVNPWQKNSASAPQPQSMKTPNPPAAVPDKRVLQPKKQEVVNGQGTARPADKRKQNQKEFQE